MNPALWGLIAACGWGGADFIARYTGRAMGHETAIFGMFCIGAAAFPLIVWLSGQPLVWDSSGAWLLVVAGIGMTLGYLLLYWAIVRGPISIAVPIMASYPAFNVIISFLMGSRPSFTEWLLMVAVMIGVGVVAIASQSFERRSPQYTPRFVRISVALSLAAALTFAVAIRIAQQATLIYGELQTTCSLRIISMGTIFLFIVLVRRQPPRVPHRWWPVLGVQGALDAFAYYALMAGSASPNPEIVVVVSASASAVTVLLARFILKETVTLLQWAGVAVIIAGVAGLSVQ